jgi:hypothetical protein
MKVKNLGANKTEIVIDDRHKIFVSYETPVAARIGAKFYRTSEKFSRTTSKHINQWLDGVNAEEKEQSFFNELLDNRA